MTSPKLTRPQYDMLSMIGANPRIVWNGEALVSNLYANHHTPQGAHQTAASLVRRNLLTRHQGVKVSYTITQAGRILLELKKEGL